MTEKYRKKPVEVEVIKFDWDKWSDELNRHKSSSTYPMVLLSIIGGFSPVIETLEGDMKVSDGDYIIKGVHGEFYPCKPDIFHETYEKVADHQPTFEVGEYYVSRSGIIYLVTDVLSDHKAYSKALIDGKFSNLFIKTSGIIFKDSKPATAEQIAEFKRAEHFAKHGRKLDEFRVGDKVSIVGTDEIVKIESLRGGAISGTSDLGNSYSISLLGGPTVTLIQTAEELREVRNE